MEGQDAKNARIQAAEDTISSAYWDRNKTMLWKPWNLQSFMSDLACKSDLQTAVIQMNDL